MSHIPCSHKISVDDHDETASCLSPKAALSIRIGPFDVPISPAGTPQRDASPRRSGREFRWSEPVDVWAILRDSSSSILVALQRSGEIVDRSFVNRWADKRSSDLVAELKAHAAWRSSFVGDNGGYGIREGRINEILNAGVVHFQGNTASGRPLLVFSASRYDAAKFSAQLPALLVYAMDAALKCADESINCKRQVVWLFDLHRVSRKNCSIEFLESVFDIFQKHYPECLDRLYFVNAPWVFSTVWSIASAFVDVRTREKIVFCRSIGLVEVSAEVLPEVYGGRAKFRNLRRAVALVRQGKRAIPDDDDDDDDDDLDGTVPVFHLFKSTLFWLMFMSCLVAWICKLLV